MNIYFVNIPSRCPHSHRRSVKFLICLEISRFFISRNGFSRNSTCVSAEFLLRSHRRPTVFSRRQRGRRRRQSSIAPVEAMYFCDYCCCKRVTSLFEASATQRKPTVPARSYPASNKRYLTILVTKLTFFSSSATGSFAAHSLAKCSQSQQGRTYCGCAARCSV
jgi:hypothetical protein